MPCRGRDLILANFSLPMQGVPFLDRLAAGAAGGFDGIGLNVLEYRRLRKTGLSDEEMQAQLRDHGLRVMELELLYGWGSTPEPDPRFEKAAKLMEHLGDTFGARHVQVTGVYEGTMESAAEALGLLCDRAAKVGLRIALEFLPTTNVATLGDAREMVEMTGRPNAGLCVDIWHHLRGETDWKGLAALAPEQITNVQIDDGPLEPVLDDYLQDTMHHRQPLGEGQFDLARFMEVIDATGSDAPLSVEVLSDELWTRSAAEVGRVLGETTRSALG